MRHLLLDTYQLILNVTGAEMVSMTIINKVIHVYAYLHHTHVTKTHFGTGAVRLSIRIFFTIKPHNHVKMPRITNFLSEKFKLSLKRFLTAISVIYVILELIRIINRELSCQLTDLIFG